MKLQQQRQLTLIWMNRWSVHRWPNCRQTAQTLPYPSTKLHPLKSRTLEWQDTHAICPNESTIQHTKRDHKNGTAVETEEPHEKQENIKASKKLLEESSKPEDSGITTQKLEDTEQKDATAEAKPPPKELLSNAKQDKTSQYTNRDTPKGMAMYTQQVVTFGYASSNWQWSSARTGGPGPIQVSAQRSLWWWNWHSPHQEIHDMLLLQFEDQSQSRRKPIGTLPPSFLQVVPEDTQSRHTSNFLPLGRSMQWQRLIDQKSHGYTHGATSVKRYLFTNVSSGQQEEHTTYKCCWELKRNCLQ